MRERQYLTMLDPIQEKSGAVVVVLVYIATLCGDVFWTASILVALGQGRERERKRERERERERGRERWYNHLKGILNRGGKQFACVNTRCIPTGVHSLHVQLHIYLTGTSLSVIVNIPLSIAIVSSSAATVFYTMFGQMISVAYTDIVQLIFIIIGLVYIYNIYIRSKCSAL